MKEKIRIILVEDNVRYRAVVDLALRQDAGLQLCDQFGTAEIALRSLRETSGKKLPDVILLDLRLPGIDGLQAIPEFLSAAPDAKVIVLTQSDMEEDVLKAISSGASGYLLKSATVSEIIEGIRTVVAGGASLDPGVARFILKTLKARLPKTGEQPLLTERQIEILKLLGEGMVKKEIADHLKIGYGTVDDHVTNIYQKLGVRNAPAAVGKAHTLGLLRGENKT